MLFLRVFMEEIFCGVLPYVNEGQRGLCVRPHESHDTRTTATKLQTSSRLFHLVQLVKLWLFLDAEFLKIVT